MKQVTDLKATKKTILMSLLGLALVLPTTGCGKRTVGVSALPDGQLPTASAAPTTPGADTAMPGATDPYLPNPGDDNGDGLSDLPQQPTDIPEPLPAPTRPVEPGAPFVAKAVSNTTAFQIPQVSDYFKMSGLYVYIHLTWQPVMNAAEYWVYKDRIPAFQEANRQTAYAVVPGGFAQAGFKDGLEAPNLVGGNLMDKARRAFQMVMNRPGVAYKYKVIAVDPNGIPMCESNFVETVPLAPVTSATLNPLPQSETNTLNPLFTWQDSQQGGDQPDGYYVSVFPSIDLRNGQLPPTSIAYWSTFRNGNTKLARYGSDSANQTSYAGTMPFNITFNLRPAMNYSWTVISVKTDTGNMKTATAISRSWSGFGHFKIAPNAKPPITTSSYNRYAAPMGYQAPNPYMNQTQNRYPVPNAPRF